MAKLALNIAVVLLAILGGFYQIYLKPILFHFGLVPARIIKPIANTNCETIRQLEACEKIVLHQPTGLIYLACSTLRSRPHWTPALSKLNTSGASNEDYVATYDPATSRITILDVPDFNNGRGLQLHGMDVVPSESNPNDLFVYLVNHRLPLGDAPATETGADSVIEIFKTRVGSKSLQHITTVDDSSVIITPNDIVGSVDGKSFYFTNDHISRTGFMRHLEALGHRGSSVGYCHVDEGCKTAVNGLHSSNGIASAPNGTIYVADSVFGSVTVLEKQTDNTLVISETIPTDFSLDNISFDANGHLWAAGFPLALAAIKHFANPSLLSPSTVERISINTGVNAFYGEKYKVEQVFADDGSLASGVTTAVFDSERHRLFLDGVTTKHLVVCSI